MQRSLPCDDLISLRALVTKWVAYEHEGQSQRLQHSLPCDCSSVLFCSLVWFWLLHVSEQRGWYGIHQEHDESGISALSFNPLFDKAREDSRSVACLRAGALQVLIACICSCLSVCLPQFGVLYFFSVRMCVRACVCAFVPSAVQVDREFIDDNFNLYGLRALVPHYNEALDMVLGMDSPGNERQVSLKGDDSWNLWTGIFLL